MADTLDKDFKTNLQDAQGTKGRCGESQRKMMHQQNGNINKYASWKS